MNKRYLLIFIVFCIELTTSKAQKIETIWDYNSLYNSYSVCKENKVIGSPILLNGILVLKGYGFIELPTIGNQIDSIHYIYYKGLFVFSKIDYDKVISYEHITDHSSIKNANKKVKIQINCIIESIDTFIVKTYSALFPFHWLLCSNCSELYSHIYRITDNHRGDCVISLDTYGYYLNIIIHEEKNTDRKKKRILKKHKRVYGRL